MQKTRSVLQEVGWSWNSYELPRTLLSLPSLFTIIKIKRFIQQNQSWVFCQVLHVSAPLPTEFLLRGQSQTRWDESHLYFALSFNISNSKTLCAERLRRLSRKVLHYFCNIFLKSFPLCIQCCKSNAACIIHLIFCECINFSKLREAAEAVLWFCRRIRSGLDGIACKISLWLEWDHLTPGASLRYSLGWCPKGKCS